MSLGIPTSLRQFTLDGPPPRIADHEFRGRRAWTAATLRREDWLITIPEAALAEVVDLMETLRRNPVVTYALDPRDYQLAACRSLMAGVKDILVNGAGFVVLDRLPVDRYGKDELKNVYWILSRMIERPVAQSFDGTLLYDVTDTGKKIAVRVRGDRTNQELSMHTDYGFNFPPPYIGLLVLRTARSGGESSVVSMETVHNEFRCRYPDLLERLYRPYFWNRQGEHAPDEPITNVNPFFSFDGERLRVRVNRRLIYMGHELMEQPLDERGREAMEALYEVMSDPALQAHFTLEAGQVQYLNNWGCAHMRTEYEDFEEPEAKRHLVRIFLRDEGRPSYMG